MSTSLQVLLCLSLEILVLYSSVSASSFEMRARRAVRVSAEEGLFLLAVEEALLS